MKKVVLFLIAFSLMLSFGAVSFAGNASGHDFLKKDEFIEPNIEPIAPKEFKIEPRVIDICPSAPDNKHHFYGTGAPTNVRFYNDDGSYRCTKEMGEHTCDYCGWEILAGAGHPPVDYVAVSNLWIEGVTQIAGWYSDVQPTDSSYMIFYR